VVGLWRMGAAYIHQGDVQQGAECCNEALALGPLPYDAAMAKAVRGYGEIKAGLLDAAIADLGEAMAWFANSRLRYTLQRYALWLAEAHLRRGDRAAARSLIEDVLETSRSTGYLHFEGLASWLMGECLAPEAPASAEPHIETAMAILERIGARNDLARAMVTRAVLRQAARDIPAARQLLGEADIIFHQLGTLDEPARVELALTALDRGSPIQLLGDLSRC
jgi:tetratricopeptide (TPR) repeat protein